MITAVALALIAPLALASAPVASAAGQLAPPGIDRQPIHAVAMLNGAVTLSVGVSPVAPASQVVWKIDDASGGHTIGTGATYTINNLTMAEHGHRFWAELTNAGGTTRSEDRMFAVVDPPIIVGPLLTGTIHTTMNVPSKFTVSAKGGYANVARVVAEITIPVPGGRISADRLHGAATTAIVPTGNLMKTTVTQPVSYGFSSSFSVVWKTCVIVAGNNDPCPVEVPNARTADPGVLQSGHLPHPRISGDLPPLSIAGPGEGTRLAVVLEPSPVRPGYLWETSSDGKSWTAAADPDEPNYILRDVSAVDGTWFRVTVSNAAGSVTSAPTQVRAMKYDQAADHGFKYNLWFFNETTDPVLGNNPITLVPPVAPLQPSDRYYAPSGFVQLQTSWGIRVPWKLAAWFDMRIDDTWTVRVLPNLNGANCQFKRADSETWAKTSSAFACVDSRGDANLRSAGETEGRLYLVNTPVAGVKDFSGKAAATLASLVCGHADLKCEITGNRTETETLVTGRSEVGANCSQTPFAESVGTWVWLVSTITKATSSTFSEGWSISANLGLEVSKKAVTGSAGVTATYNRSWSESTIDETTDSYQIQIGLMPGQKAYVATYAYASTYKGTITFTMAGQRYALKDATLTTIAGDVSNLSYLPGDKPPYVKKSAVYVVQMDQAEWNACAAKVTEAAPIYKFLSARVNCSSWRPNHGLKA